MKRYVYGFGILVALFAVVDWCKSRPARVGIASRNVVDERSRQQSASGFTPLLADEAVRRELGLSHQQKAHVGDLTEVYRAKYRHVSDTRNSKSGSHESEIELARQYWIEAQRLIEPDQLVRLKQIRWQLMGISVFFDDEFRLRLMITDKQLAEIERSRDSIRAARRQGIRNHRKHRQDTKEALADTLELLTAEQRAAFDDLIGVKFLFVY